MGSSGGFDPISIIANIVFSAITGGMGGSVGGSSPVDDTAAEAEHQAQEREAQARRAEDRRAEEAVLKAQARKQQLSQSRQATTLGAGLDDGDSLAGRSMHGQTPVATSQLKEKLGQ